MKKLNVGLVGAGFMGKAHSIGYSDMPKYFWPAPAVPVLKTICDIVPEIAADAKERFGFEKCCTDWRDIVNDPEIDVVSICTPNNVHAEIAIAALNAGKHVLCEKPIASTLEDAKAMAEAAKGLACGMTAVLGLDREKLSACCEQAAEAGCVQICNYNCPGQLVIGGEKAAVEQAAALAKEAGARRCIPLKVSGPFHTRLMAPAGDALAQRFAGENFGAMETPVLFNCLGHEKAETDSIPQLLVKQVQSSVYMEDTLRRLGELGVDHILEVGPGNALSGFVKKTLPGVVCTAVETPEQLDAVLTAWKDAE